MSSSSCERSWFIFCVFSRPASTCVTGVFFTDAAAKKADDLFAFPPEGERRPWKYFLTLKDQSKVMRLMFHMHHKSAYKCNAVHCSLTTNNGTLFKLHLRNHEKCDVCTPDDTAYTCMNTRLVCVYCGYKGADLAEHVYKRHAVSQFQCGYCFYRTRQNAYMHEHQVGGSGVRDSTTGEFVD